MEKLTLKMETFQVQKAAPKLPNSVYFTALFNFSTRIGPIKTLLTCGK